MVNSNLAARKPRRGNPLALSTQLCFALYSTLLGVNRVYRKLLRELRLTYPQYLVLLVLWEEDDQRVSDICERLFLETATLTPLLKRLEGRGLIRRQRSASDEREVRITLTSEGRATRSSAASIPGCVAQAMACSPNEIAELRDRLARMRKALLESS